MMPWHQQVAKNYLTQLFQKSSNIRYHGDDGDGCVIGM